MVDFCPHELFTNTKVNNKQSEVNCTRCKLQDFCPHELFINTKLNNKQSEVNCTRCKLQDFCPHELFTNTKVNDEQSEVNCTRCKLQDFCLLFTNTNIIYVYQADLGPCPSIHDEDLRKQYNEAKDCSKKNQFEEDFLR